MNKKMNKKHYQLIEKGDDLFDEVKPNYHIHKKPYTELKDLIEWAYHNMLVPWLYHIVVYLSEKQLALANGWSSFFKEFNRRLDKKVKTEPVMQWCKEQAFHSHHEGLHYHIQIIGETKGSRLQWHIESTLFEMKEAGYITNFYHCEPDTKDLGKIKTSLRDPELKADLLNWVSYTCKQETKEGLSGRLYGRTRLPAQQELLALAA